MSPIQWALWAVVLLAQNFSFTMVSRARNSGSLSRHMYASVLSNGIWFVSQILIFSELYRIITGKHGLLPAVFAGIYYTAFTMTGSLIAHYYALRNEKGKARIGAYKDVATFTKAEGEKLRQLLEKSNG